MRHLEADTYSSSCWLRSRENVGIQITQFGRSHLDLAIPTDRDLPEQVQWCWQHWPPGTALLVFDDVQHYGLNNSAALYRAMRRYAEAEPLYIRALTVFIDKLGENHPSTLAALRDFCVCLQQAIAANQQHLLSDHPLTQDLLRAIEGDSIKGI